jgi:hypothetical protein
MSRGRFCRKAVNKAAFTSRASSVLAAASIRQRKLDVGQGIGHQAPAKQRHLLRQRHHHAAQRGEDGLGLGAILAGDHGVPEAEVDVAPQVHLEIDGIALGGVDRRKRTLEARIGGDVKPGTQAAEQFADAGDGGEAKGLAPGQAPLVNAGQQQGQAQRARLVVGAGLGPVARQAGDFGHRDLQGRRIAFQRQPEQLGEGILRHARRQALDVGMDHIGQGIGGQRKGAATVLTHNAHPP